VEHEDATEGMGAAVWLVLACLVVVTLVLAFMVASAR
jgi:hypothetical protein